MWLRQNTSIYMFGMLQSMQPLYACPLSFNSTALRRFSASCTCSSVHEENEALTNAVLRPLGRKAVPGSARTPPSYALVRISSSESPSSTPGV